MCFKVYAALRRANPTNPNKPEPNNHAAAGTGTGEIVAVVQVPASCPVLTKLKLNESNVRSVAL